MAVASAIQKISNSDTQIKWPNDIMLSNRKCSGLLMETTKVGNQHYLLAGIGVNCNQGMWPNGFTAVGIAEILKSEVVLIDVLHEVMDFISLYLKRIKNYEILELEREFDSLLWQAGNWLMLEAGGEQFEGKMSKVDSEGRLVFLDREGLERRMHNGQVRVSKNNPFFSPL